MRSSTLLSKDRLDRPDRLDSLARLDHLDSLDSLGSLDSPALQRTRHSSETSSHKWNSG